MNWNVSKLNRSLISKIVARCFSLGLKERESDLFMDLISCHNNGNKLDFIKLSGFNDFSFLHDVCGIIEHIDRDTGKLLHCFLPRCSKK